MASPQLENGFTSIAHEIMEALAKINLSPYESRALWFLLRKTYGWKKKSDWISGSQFSAGLGGLDRSNIWRALKTLKSKNIIVVSSDYRDVPIYSFQKDYSKWCALSKTTTGVVSLDTGSVVSLDTGCSLNRHTQKILLQKIKNKSGAKAPNLFSSDSKEKTQTPPPPSRRGIKRVRAGAVPPELQAAVSRIVAKMNELAGTDYKPDSKIVLRGLVVRLKAGAAEADCMSVVEDRWSDWGEKTEMRQHFNPETLFRESNFEKYLNAVRMNGRNGNGGPPKIIREDDETDSYILEDGTQFARPTYWRRYGRPKEKSVH
jgi:phage replication O-like protein O